MNNIEYKYGAVCFADERQWFASKVPDSDKFGLVNDDGRRKYSFYGMISFAKDFQLNEIRQGDYIEASELDTEQKYNDAVEVFELFGFEFKFSADDVFYTIRPEQCIFSAENGLMLYGSTRNRGGKRLAYTQLMAIGKLKRAMLEREKKDKANSLMDEVAKYTEGGIKSLSPMFIDLSHHEVNSNLKSYAEAVNESENTFKLYSKELLPDFDLDEKPKRRNKSKQAYDILKSLDYE